ncbi:hypothetical protein GCM10011490_25820 [Pseudoclavibacter endophyticus]|uniref:Transglycosylase SLT domain-containing protein n=2 Tax=Pseudoclavibacter endophyticus TaxID=1778590 RepID=A0A6H9WPS7_9MICO|nr:transglycosylase SLT domain-containing protein [Pseudoclavibacter endophyticus]GGA73759.1 hypothetical protein GCM10011490_25820 [Pseudoclavibacter endophyticus]
MTDQHFARVGAVRAVRPRAARNRTAKVLAPAVASFAIAGIALVAVAQGAGGTQEVSSVPSIDEIAQAQAQGYGAALVGDQEPIADDSVTTDRAGEAGAVTVTTPEPKPEPEPIETGSGTDSTGGNSGGAPTDVDMAYDPDSFKGYAASRMGAYGWGSDQMQCLDLLWEKESNWNPNAENPSGAFGIPQAMPLHFPNGWGEFRTNAYVQIDWGLNYIAGSSYGAPCAAWNHSQANNWY